MVLLYCPEDREAWETNWTDKESLDGLFQEMAWWEQPCS